MQRLSSNARGGPPMAAALSLWLLAAACTPVHPAVGGVAEGEPGVPILYAAGDFSYVIESRDSLSMRMPDETFQTQVTVKTAWVKLSLRAAVDGFDADLRLDSMRLDRPNQLVQPLVDSAVGTRWRGRLRPDGHVDSLTPDRQSVLGEQLRTMFHRLFPVLPPGGARRNDQWADSAGMPFQLLPAVSARETRSSRYRAVRTETTEGVRTLRIESVTGYSVSGGGTSFGQRLDLTGSGVATGVHLLSLAGILQQASVIDSVSVSLSLPAIGQTVPTVVKGSYTLRLLR